MNRLRLLLKCRTYLRQGLSRVTRLAAENCIWLVRLARPEARVIPAPLEPCANELRRLVTGAQARAEATVVRAARKLDTRFGASSRGIIKGVHGAHEELLVWQRAQVPGSTDAPDTAREKGR